LLFPAAELLSREASMKRGIGYVMVVAAVLASACSKTKEGDVVLDRPGDVDVDVQMTKDTVKLPNMPDVDVNTKKDTIIVDKPTVQMKKDTVIVKRPTVDVKKAKPDTTK
jgi:hypothetical protein